jgi:hypothetical protein
MITAETLDAKTGEWKTLAAFETFDVFYAYALTFKKSDAETLLRVHIPGVFVLSPQELHDLNGLGIERI